MTKKFINKKIIEVLSFGCRETIKLLRLLTTCHKYYFTSNEDDTELESRCVVEDVELFSSSLLSDFLTAPTRSFAILDQDSNRLCANQHAAGPKPLIFYHN